MSSFKKNILLVDDDLDFREVLASAFPSSKYRITEASSVNLGMLELEKKRYDLVISDFKMPQYNGLDFLDQIKKKYPLIPVIIITGYISNDLISQALKKGVVNFFEKPFFNKKYNCLY